MREHTVTDSLTCMGCGLPIEGEPFTHHSVLHIIFVAHDFHCCMNAYTAEVRRLCYSNPNKVEAWLEATA